VGFLLLAAGLVARGSVFGEEQQSHGYAFEHAVIRQMWGDRERTSADYTGEWDIPAAENRFHPGVPISIKCIQWGNSVYLGDAVRQRSITEPFEMVVGFYEKSGDGTTARLKAVHHLKIVPADWNRWWGGVPLADLQKFDRIAKQGSIEEARALAKPEAARLRQLSEVFDINPKIDKSQRRIQCSIPFGVFYEKVLKDSRKPEPQESLVLFDRLFMSELMLGVRSRE
jgi:hypothetical protein